MKKGVTCLFLVLTAFNSAFAATTPEDRIRDHLLIDDVPSAYQEASMAMKGEAPSNALHRLWVQVLWRRGEIDTAVKAWKDYKARFPDDKESTQLLEELCWGVIKDGSQSPAPPVRLVALVAALLGQDVKSVDIIVRGLNDDNAVVRSIAVKVASAFPDAKIRKAVSQLIGKETLSPIRLEAIQTLGALRDRQSRDLLLSLLTSPHSDAATKAVAVQALVAISDDVGRQELETLCTSSSGGLRLLCCELVAHFQHWQDLDLIASLLQDPVSDVKIAAITTLGLFKETPQDYNDKIDRCLHDVDPEVVVAAAWWSQIHAPERLSDAWQGLLSHRTARIRHLAAAALSMTGPRGYATMKAHFASSKDPYIRLNLALGLLGVAQEKPVIEQATQVVYDAFVDTTERWAAMKSGAFEVIVPSDDVEDRGLLHPVEIQNQQQRLEVLGLLAVMAPDKARAASERFFQMRTWGVAAVTATLLLQECGDEMRDVIVQMLHHPKKDVAVQAALVLALWGRDPQALTVLQESYPTADRVLKEVILEGVGKVGDTSSLPFLTEQLSDPYQNLRLISAASIIRCINH